MRRKNAIPATVIHFVLLAAIAGLLAACAPTLQDSQWTGAEAPKENKVLYLRQTHDVRFEAGTDALSPAEQQRLAAFVAREDVGRSDEISLAAGGDGREQTLASRRASWSSISASSPRTSGSSGISSARPRVSRIASVESSRRIGDSPAVAL